MKAWQRQTTHGVQVESGAKSDDHVVRQIKRPDAVPGHTKYRNVLYTSDRKGSFDVHRGSEYLGAESSDLNTYYTSLLPTAWSEYNT